MGGYTTTLTATTTTTTTTTTITAIVIRTTITTTAVLYNILYTCRVIVYFASNFVAVAFDVAIRVGFR